LPRGVQANPRTNRGGTEGDKKKQKDEEMKLSVLGLHLVRQRRKGEKTRKANLDGIAGQRHKMKERPGHRKWKKQKGERRTKELKAPWPTTLVRERPERHHGSERSSALNKKIPDAQIIVSP